MNKKVMELLNNQKEARNVLALSLLGEVKESLSQLGCEELLTTNNTKTIIKEVEVIKEVVKEVPVEVIKEVIVEKIVEVEREAVIDGAMIAELEAKDKEIQALKKTVATWQSKASKPVVKEDESLKLENNKLKEEIAKLKQSFENKEAMYKKLINSLNKQNNCNPAQESKPAVVETKAQDVSDIKIISSCERYITGQYNGVFFEASRAINATNIYDTSKWEYKDEINKILIDKNLLSSARMDKDIYRVESEIGSCHEIDPEKYMGFVIVDDAVWRYVFDKKHEKGRAAIQPLDTYIKFPNAKFQPCKSMKITNAINSIIDVHNKNKAEYAKQASINATAIFNVNAPAQQTQEEPQVNKPVIFAGGNATVLSNGCTMNAPAPAAKKLSEDHELSISALFNI